MFFAIGNMHRLRACLSALAILSLVCSVNGHFVVTYPEQRGQSYDAQFVFPCGGNAPTTNRSQWPTTGGALSFIPIHPFALTTVNIALGSQINENGLSNPYNVPMVPLFNQTGSNSTFCIPKIKIPKSLAGDVKDGVNATIQVIQLTATGASLYSCIDITFSDKEADRFGAPEVWDHYCFNGTGMGGYQLGEKDPSTLNRPITTSDSPRSNPSSWMLPLLGVLWLCLWLVGDFGQ